MQSLILALALINAPVEEQYEMLADLYDADPRLAYEVLDVADELGADTNELAISVAIVAISDPGRMFDPVTDGQWAPMLQTTPDVSPSMLSWGYPKNAVMKGSGAFGYRRTD